MTGTVVAGVDVAGPRRGFDLVVVGSDGQVVEALRRLSVRDVVDAVADVSPMVVCVDGPPRWAVSGGSRQAERDLKRIGISAFWTPADPGAHGFYGWMRHGMALYEALGAIYRLAAGGNVEGRCVEVFPEATAVLLAGRLRARDESKVEFRRRVLADYGVAEAVLQGADQVDAALAALTGQRALNGAATWVGDPGEGAILVPVPQLPAVRLVQPGAAPPLTQRRSRPNHRYLPMPPREPILDANGVRLCGCGCGAPVRLRFRPGHDAKLKSLLWRAAQVGDSDARQRLNELGW